MCDPAPGRSVQETTPLVTLAVPSLMTLPPRSRCQRTTVPAFDGPPVTVTVTRCALPTLAEILAVETTCATTVLLVALVVIALKEVFRVTRTDFEKTPVVLLAVTVANGVAAPDM